jgi:hypothetical protein
MGRVVVQSLRWLAVGIAGSAASYAFVLMAGAALGASMVYLAMRPQWIDQTWLLYAAGQLLHGARLGVDVMEVNPPLIIWLLTIPVLIARAFHVGSTAALQGCLILLVASSVVWSASLLRRSATSNARFAGWFALLMLFAMVMHPWPEFGQREHMLVLLVLPYLVMAARRVDGERIANGEALAAGICAGIGFLLKPHHLLVVLAVEAFVLLRRRDMSLTYRPETAAMVVTALGYAAAMLLWAPDYLLNVLPLAVSTYYGFDHAGILDLIPPMRAAKLAILMLVLAMLWRRLVHRALAAVFFLAGLGATAAFVIQMKGYPYQMVPMRAFFDLLIGTVAIDLWLQWAARWVHPVRPRLATGCASLAFIAAVAVSLPRQLDKVSHPYADQRMAVLRATSRYIPSGSTVLLVSTSPEGVFEQVLNRGWKWGSRFDCLYMVPAIVAAERFDSRDGVAPSKWRTLAVQTRDAMAADLMRWHPNPVLVDRCQDAKFSFCGGLKTIRLDLLKWLEQGSDFAGAWSDYVHEGQIGPYDLWCRNGEDETCRKILTAVRTAAPANRGAAKTSSIARRLFQ